VRYRVKRPLRYFAGDSTKTTEIAAGVEVVAVGLADLEPRESIAFGKMLARHRRDGEPVGKMILFIHDGLARSAIVGPDLDSLDALGHDWALDRSAGAEAPLAPPRAAPRVRDQQTPPPSEQAPTREERHPEEARPLRSWAGRVRVVPSPAPAPGGQS
jgi:hypothetical protein